MHQSSNLMSLLSVLRSIKRRISCNNLSISTIHLRFLPLACSINQRYRSRRGSDLTVLCRGAHLTSPSFFSASRNRYFAPSGVLHHLTRFIKTAYCAQRQALNRQPDSRKPRNARNLGHCRDHNSKQQKTQVSNVINDQISQGTSSPTNQQWYEWAQKPNIRGPHQPSVPSLTDSSIFQKCQKKRCDFHSSHWLIKTIRSIPDDSRAGNQPRPRQTLSLMPAEPCKHTFLTSLVNYFKPVACSGYQATDVVPGPGLPPSPFMAWTVDTTVLSWCCFCFFRFVCKSCPSYHQGFAWSRWNALTSVDTPWVSLTGSRQHCCFLWWDINQRLIWENKHKICIPYRRPKAKTNGTSLRYQSHTIHIESALSSGFSTCDVTNRLCGTWIRRNPRGMAHFDGSHSALCIGTSSDGSCG